MSPRLHRNARHRPKIVALSFQSAKVTRNFKSRISGGDEAVFFFAGHGVQFGAANYLLPVDIRGESEDQVRDDAIALQRVLDDLQEQKARFALAIVDACRNNPFPRTGRALGGRGLAPTTTATGQMVIYSAGAGQEALDRLGDSDRSQNGLFTRVFLQEIEKPGVPVDRVLRNVREEVVRLARSVGRDQVPALYDQTLGEFYFKPGGAAQATTAAPAVDAASNERSFWDSIKASKDVNDYRAYVAQYPSGTFRALADNRISVLSRPAPPPAAAAVTPLRPAVGRVPLNLYYSPARGDNFTTGTTAGEQSAQGAGYSFAGIEGYGFRDPQPGTVPLKLYWSAARGDNFTTASAQGEHAALANGYVFVRVEAYIYPTQQPGTVPLKNYWSQVRGDNFSTATQTGEQNARDAGYAFAWIEGYVFPAGTSP